MPNKFLSLFCALFFAATSNTHAQSRNFRYLALGDSYTIGESVSENERFPNQLVAKLRADKLFAPRFKAIINPDIIARTGWTSGELMAGIAQAKPKGPYNLVTLLIGVNNQYRGYSSDGFRRELKLLIKKAIAYADKQPSHVIIVSIPDWGVTPFANGRNTGGKVSKEIDFFNKINKEEAALAGVGFIDITPISRKVSTDAALVAPDGLHPSGKMYGEWVDLILPLARKNIQ